MRSSRQLGVLILALLAFAGSLMLGCEGSNTKTLPVKKLRIGLMITPKGLNDKGFNDLAFVGLKAAERKYSIEPLVIEPANIKDQEACLRFFAGQKLDVVIAVGVAFLDSIRQVTKEHPKLPFIVIDSTIAEGNIRGVAFREEEGSMLCGYLAASMAKSKKVGFIGGVDIEVIRRFLDGFQAGVALVSSDTAVMIKYVGTDFSGFNKPEEAKAMAMELYQNGCDVLFSAAGGSGLGVISAAVETRKYVIGVDMNQDSLAPGLVLTSMLKRVDLVVEDVVKTLSSGQGIEQVKKNYGLADGGVDITDFSFSRQSVGSDIISRLEQLRKSIVEGK